MTLSNDTFVFAGCRRGKHR